MGWPLSVEKKELLDWSEDMKWKKSLFIKADTYKVFDLFPELKENEQYLSKDERWFYTKKSLPAGGVLRTFSGRSIGHICFDKPVIIPALFDTYNSYQTPFMSMTPSEVFSLRAGTRLAKGHTVIAGLGMGYQLMNVMKRKQVREVTVIEQSQELVDFLWKPICKHLPRVPRLIVGDAYKEIPKLKGDVCLVDIFPSYGNNHKHMDKIKSSCTNNNFKQYWGWGSFKHPL